VKKGRDNGSRCSNDSLWCWNGLLKRREDGVVKAPLPCPPGKILARRDHKQNYHVPLPLEMLEHEEIIGTPANLEL